MQSTVKHGLPKGVGDKNEQTNERRNSLGNQDALPEATETSNTTETSEPGLCLSQSSFPLP